MAGRQAEVTQRLHEVALTPDEVATILSVCGARALLVGGQSLAFWASYYGVKPVGVLSAMVTSDVDFIGPTAVARQLSAALGGDWDTRIATMDDAGSHVAKVFTRVPGGGVKQVDFLSEIVGLDTAKVQQRAVEVALPSGACIRILHPLDVLESRLRNLQSLPAKRNAAGIAQAGLAIEVVRRFFETRLEAGERPRVVLSAVNHVLKLALSPRLADVALNCRLNVLDAVPAGRIAAPKFHAERWPRALERVEARRRRLAARLTRD